MSITRKFLKGMGLTDEQQDTILEAHTETVDEIKTERDRLKAEAANLPKLQKQLEQAQADLAAAQQDGWKDKHDKVKKEFDEYKAGVTAKETKAAKETAVRAFYKSKGITGDALEIAILASGVQIDSLELDGEKIKDVSALESMVSGKLSGLVGTTVIKGADVPHPPANIGGGHTMTKEQINSIKDIGKRQKAMLENSDLFGI